MSISLYYPLISELIRDALICRGMNTLSAETNAILWASIEDYFGLWEVVWELRSEPLNVPDKDCLESAQQIVRGLLGKRWVKLYGRRGVTFKEEPLPEEEWATILADNAAWSEPENANALAVLIASTDEGEAAYQASQ